MTIIERDNVSNMESGKKDKLEKLQAHVVLLEEGHFISISYIMRIVRVGYQTAKELLDILLDKGLIESYEGWVGSKINGERADGYEITKYRTAAKK